MTKTISWDDVMRRIANGEPAEDVLDEKHAADRVEFRAYLAGLEGPRAAGAVERYDHACRDLDLGLTQARMAWHSISPAQRRALVEIAAGRPSGAGIRTLRALAAHDLVAWDGGAFAPETKVVISERGRFVLKHGMQSDA